jgi:hypothetical protein
MVKVEDLIEKGGQVGETEREKVSLMKMGVSRPRFEDW